MIGVGYDAGDFDFFAVDLFDGLNQHVFPIELESVSQRSQYRSECVGQGLFTNVGFDFLFDIKTLSQTYASVHNETEWKTFTFTERLKLYFSTPLFDAMFAELHKIPFDQIGTSAIALPAMELSVPHTYDPAQAAREILQKNYSSLFSSTLGNISVTNTAYSFHVNYMLTGNQLETPKPYEYRQKTWSVPHVKCTQDFNLSAKLFLNSLDKTAYGSAIKVESTPSYSDVYRIDQNNGLQRENITNYKNVHITYFFAPPPLFENPTEDEVLKLYQDKLPFFQSTFEFVIP